MNRNGLSWILGGIAVLGLSAVSVIFGLSLLPSSKTMQSKLGTLAPLVITWGMIWISVLMGIALAGFLFATGMSKARRSN